MKILSHSIKKDLLAKVSSVHYFVHFQFGVFDSFDVISLRLVELSVVMLNLFRFWQRSDEKRIRRCARFQGSTPHEGGWLQTMQKFNSMSGKQNPPKRTKFDDFLFFICAAAFCFGANFRNLLQNKMLQRQKKSKSSNLINFGWFWIFVFPTFVPNASPRWLTTLKHKKNRPPGSQQVCLSTIQNYSSNEPNTIVSFIFAIIFDFFLLCVYVFLLGFSKDANAADAKIPGFRSCARLGGDEADPVL